MKISCTDVGKRFNRDWIFKHFSYEFTTGYYAITGPNGSGKSTLLQVIAGALIHSEGRIEYRLQNNAVLAEEKVFNHLSIASPGLELIEEMTLKEFLVFHGQFKKYLAGVSVTDIISLTGLQKSAHKQLRYFSSGMKQRVKLAQAVFSDTACLLLDEPCTNFDESGFILYHQLIEKYAGDRLVIVSSNDKNEYHFCNVVLDILQYKT